MFVLIASSCSQDDEAMDAAVLAKEINSEIAAKGGNVSATAVTEPFTMPDVICADEEFEFCLNFAPEFNSKGKPQKTNLQVQLLVEGDDPDTEETETEYFQQIFQGDYTPNEGDTGPAKVCFDYTFNTDGVYTLRYKIGDGGFLPSNNGMTVTVDNCGCIYDGNAFTGAAVSCDASREANFTFSSEDGVGYFKMQGGLTNFTVADATIILYDADDNVISDGYTVTQVIQGQNSNRRITVEGDLGSCGSIRVNIKWDSTNSGSVITGDWSVKDVYGVDYTAEVAGLECL